jgi:hypothetical protein
MTDFPTALDIIFLIIIAVSALPLVALAGFEVGEAFRKRSPDSLRFRERLDCGIANAKLVVTQKVAAGWRLVKLLGALMWLAPSFAVWSVAYGVGIVVSPLAFLIECARRGVTSGYDSAFEDGLSEVNARALRVVRSKNKTYT